MSDHVKMLGTIGVLRALLGAALAVLLLWKGASLSRGDYPDVLYTPGVLSFDRTAFLTLGGLSAVLAVLRAVQAAGILRRAAWARTQGLWLAAFDAANLLLFPLSTALGLYGLVVYKDRGSLMWFERRGQ